MSRVALVTGAGRGIGAEICRQLLRAGDTVLACPRVVGSPALSELAARHAARMHEIPLDVSNESSVEAAAQEAGRRVDRIDLLFNNAGAYHKNEETLSSLDAETLSRAFRINAVGPLLVVRALLPLLRRGRDKRLIQLTSLMGSVGDNASGGAYGYRMSKAALNMAVRNLAHELGGEGFTALAIHPGWVRTDMGGPSAPVELESAVVEIIRLALETPAARNGALIGPGGEVLPY